MKDEADSGGRVTRRGLVGGVIGAGRLVAMQVQLV